MKNKRYYKKTKKGKNKEKLDVALSMDHSELSCKLEICCTKLRI